MTSLEPHQRLDELLDLAALSGLPDGDGAELERLSRRLPGERLTAERFQRERAAAALALALGAGVGSTPPPAGFQDRIRARLQAELARPASPAAETRPRGSERSDRAPRPLDSADAPRGRRWLMPLGYGLAAAAACLWLVTYNSLGAERRTGQTQRERADGLAVDLAQRDDALRAQQLAAESAEGEQRRLAGELAVALEEQARLRRELEEERALRGSQFEELALARGELADLRLRLSESEQRTAQLEALLAGPDEQVEFLKLLALDSTLKRPWTVLGDPSLEGREISGELVWNSDQSRGYMRFMGLPENDPGQSQYQLWIFDRTLSDATPIDGGVFDIPAGLTPGEAALVAIDPKIQVNEAWRFAITLERPGGVVVSDRSRLLLLADA